MRIEEAIQQKTFPSEYIKLQINLMYTASWSSVTFKRLLDEYNISWQQFNILRILRGAKGKPLALKDISSRMVDKTSNTSRLVDKLLDKEMVQRVTCPKDRRRVEIVITDHGLTIIGQASHKVESRIEDVFSAISEEDARRVNDLLDAIRENQV